MSDCPCTFDVADPELRTGDRFHWPAPHGDAVQAWRITRVVGRVDSLMLRVVAVPDNPRPGPVAPALDDFSTHQARSTAARGRITGRAE